MSSGSHESDRNSALGEVYVFDSEFVCEAYFSNEVLQVAEVPSKTVPCAIMQAQTIQRQPVTKALIVLLTRGVPVHI
jgi:hypothetical protein